MPYTPVGKKCALSKEKDNGVQNARFQGSESQKCCFQGIFGGFFHEKFVFAR